MFGFAYFFPVLKTNFCKPHSYNTSFHFVFYIQKKNENDFDEHI